LITRDTLPVYVVAQILEEEKHASHHHLRLTFLDRVARGRLAIHDQGREVKLVRLRFLIGGVNPCHALRQYLVHKRLALGADRRQSHEDLVEHLPAKEISRRPTRADKPHLVFGVDELQHRQALVRVGPEVDRLERRVVRDTEACLDLVDDALQLVFVRRHKLLQLVELGVDSNLCCRC